MKDLELSRRTILRGMGAAIALPWLEAMMPRTVFGAASSAAAPRRMAFLYVPNGIDMANWTPAAEGALTKLPSTLEPLAPFQKDLLVLSGLTLDKARPHGDGGGDHARAMAAFLTGRQPRKTHGADIRVGVSVDQLAAEKIGKATRFASLEIGCEGGKNSGNCDSGYSCAYSANLAWRNESSPVAKEVNPRQVFERLFSAPGKGDDKARRRERYKHSILDFAGEDARNLKNRLGSTDQRKLDEYLTGVREIEQRLVRVEQTPDLQAPVGAARPTGIPKDYREHLRLMADMLVLAFQADLTRVATFVFANDGSNRSYRAYGVSEGHHDMSHHGGSKNKKAKIQKINQFHIEQVAYLLGKLQSIKEGNGTLLDNCMIVYGSGISDGNRHNHDDLPILLAGKGGGTLKTGRHLHYPRETPLMNLYLCMLDRMGVRVDSFGDSKGRLTGLEG
ncbi:MAG TPA: DUF1552 domain-containing protein [Gemmataceae bacterium]|nr:DUF1552 domain-containing protein [Gemmataceae bacterium]